MQIPPGLRAYLLVLAIFVKVSLVANDLTISPLRLTKRHQLMLPILQNSMRLVCRSHLLLTTALISVAPMAFVGGMARAQEYYLDNAAPGGTRL